MIQIFKIFIHPEMFSSSPVTTTNFYVFYWNQHKENLTQLIAFRSRMISKQKPQMCNLIQPNWQSAWRQAAKRVNQSPHMNLWQGLKIANPAYSPSSLTEL